jgi:Binding-protein-dependent transport system inner membrane component
MEIAALSQAVPARRWRLPRTLVVGLTMLAATIVVAVAGPFLLPQSPTALNFREALKPPSAAHWFGTDNFGRDVLTRIVYGASIDLQFGFVSVIPTFISGTILGILAGMYRRIDAVLMRLVDLVVAFPVFVLVIAISASLGPGIRNMFIAVWIIGWASYARLARSEVLVVKALPYVEAAEISRPFARAHPGAPCPSQCHRSAGGVGDDQLGCLDSSRQLARLPRARRPAADAGMGRHDRRRPQLSRSSAVAFDLSGVCDLFRFQRRAVPRGWPCRSPSA